MRDLEALIASAQQTVLDALSRESGLSALLLVGSFATNTSDAASDIDILAIMREKEGSMTLSCPTIKVEVTFGTYTSVTKRMQSAAPDNNNYVLNIMTNARILVDKDGEGRSLTELARDLYRVSPPAPDDSARTASMKALEILRDVVKRVTSRGGESPEKALLGRMRSDQLLAKAIYLTFWIERKRTSALPEMFRRVKAEYPELAIIIASYAESCDLGEQADLADRAAIIALRHMEALSIGAYSTGSLAL